MQKIFASFLIAFSFSAVVFSQSFTPGNIVVVRVGDGSAALSPAAQPVFLDEFSSLTGQLVQSLALPTTVSGNNRRLTMSGTATSEGALTLSSNKQYLCLAGYDTTVGTSSVSSSVVGKVAAIVSANGSINTQTGIAAGSAYNTNNVRGAVTNDGSGVWFSGVGSGGSGGTYYVPANTFTTSPTKISSTPTNTRTVNIFGGQLYVSSASSNFYGVSQVGNGIPTTSGQTTTLLNGVNDSSTYAFVVFDASANEPGNDLIYVADDNIANGGIIKYSKVNGVWINNGKIGASRSMRGLALLNACGRIRGYVSSQDTIYTFTDISGYNQPLNATLVPLVSKSSNTVFRGIAFAPGTLDPVPPSASLGASSPVKCFGGSNGSATITVTGGTGNLTYSWSDGGLGAVRNNLPQGIYSVTVTDQIGCTAVVSNINISQPNAALSASVNKTNVSCFGQSNGSITVAATGGTPNYQYSWSSGNGTNLPAGVYSVTITDANNCTLIVTDTVKQPAPLTLSSTKGNITCGSTNNGFINLSVSGGNGGNTFVWNDNNTSPNRSNLTAGVYAVTVTDSKGCTAERKDTIVQTANLNVIGTVNPVSCYGGNNGSISVNPVGGSGNYSFSWSGGLSGANPANLSAGTYSVTVDDGNNCTGANSFIVTQPDSISIVPTINHPNCYGGTGSIVLNISGGSGTLTTVWSNNVNPSALVAGNYIVTVTDGNNCSKTASFTLVQPDSISISGQVTNASSFGASDGSIILTVSGGTPNYDYDWGNNITVKDRNNLPAGTYTVTVTDDRNCTKSKTFVVSQPSSQLSVSQDNWVKHVGYRDAHWLFSINLPQSNLLQVNTYDVNGRLLFTRLFSEVSHQTIAVPTEGLASGIYFIQFQSNGKTVSTRVAVNN
jgi:hypothetical protein